MGLLSSVSFLLYVFAWATNCFSGATAEVCKSCRMAGYKAVGSRSTRPTEEKVGFEACVDDWCLQDGTDEQYTRCEAATDGGDTCINPLIKYGATDIGIPVDDPVDFSPYCKMFFHEERTASYTTGERDCSAAKAYVYWCNDGKAWCNIGHLVNPDDCRVAGTITSFSCKTGKARSVSNDPIGRALGSLTTSDYDIKFTEENKRILESYHLLNKRMVRDTSVNPTSETLEWTQVSRCFWSCEEEYLLVDYYQDGDKSNPVMKVFVAKSELSPPSEFRTSGYEGYLHFGFLYFGDQNQAIFFVLHPNGWGPYQHRFKTNSFTAFFNKGVGSVVTNAAGAAAGAAIGSIVPGVGTIIGGLVGASVGALSDDYFGDYLRYIG